jgi:hypothetical protein
LVGELQNNQTVTQCPKPRFYCKKCDTDWDDKEPNWTHEKTIQSCCPNCGLLCILRQVCGLCREPIGKKSKGKRCGYCHAIFISQVTERRNG